MGTPYDDLITDLAQQAGADTARVELTLWTLVKGSKRAEARTRVHPVGIELVVTVDGELEWSQAFAPQVVDTLLESAAASQQRVFLADGWKPAGSR
jgi:hypothetical protein